MEDSSGAPCVDANTSAESVNQIVVNMACSVFGRDAELPARVIHYEHNVALFIDDITVFVVHDVDLVAALIVGLDYQLIAILHQPHFLDFLRNKLVHLQVPVPEIEGGHHHGRTGHHGSGHGQRLGSIEDRWERQVSYRRVNFPSAQDRARVRVEDSDHAAFS